MYKIRFARWGFVKNTPRSAASTPTASTKTGAVRVKTSKSHQPKGQKLPLPAILQLSHHDGLTLDLLKSIHTWSVAFFEISQCSTEFPPVLRLQPKMHQPWLEVSKETSSTFKLVIDLLEDGHGRLAGRMVRKAFLRMEDMLTLEPPALIWNLLEIMHNMVTLRNMQLFQILLKHLTGLVDDTLPMQHPLRFILSGLGRAVANLKLAASSRNGVSCGSFASRASTTSTDRLAVLSPDLTFLLERAWLINADILFRHFDPQASQLYQLYFQINWDSCLLGRPTAIVEAATQWFKHIDNQMIRVAPARFDNVHCFLATTAARESKLLQSLLAPRMDASPPQGFDSLRASIMTSLRAHADYILAKEVDFHGSATTLLRLLAALGNAKFLDQCDKAFNATMPAGDQKLRVPRIQAANLACAIKAWTDISPDYDGDVHGSSLVNIERLRSIVALTEYAHSEAHPHVVQGMWQLSRALVAAGRYEEAEDVKSSVLDRLEAYTQHIPDNSA